jgi:NitT/TauT family transport system substrate-binding protein
VEPALRETLLVRGRADAITANMSSGMVALTKLGVARDDMVVMRYSDFGVPLYGNAILANPGFIRDNPRAVAGFLRGYLRGLKDAHLDRRGGIAMLKQFEPLVDEQFEAAGLDIIIDQEIASAPARTNGVGEIDVVKFQHGIDMLARVVAFNTRPDPASLIDMRWLPSKAQRMIF